MQVINATRPAGFPLEIGWHNWQSLFTDATLWQAVVNDITEALGLAGSPPLRAGYPGTCAVFIVEQQCVFKFFPPMVAEDCAREHLVYQLLDARVPAMPHLLAAGVYRERVDWPFLVFSFVPGVAIRECFVDLPSCDRRALAREVGWLLRQVHDTAVSETTLSKSWPDFMARRQAACLQELRNIPLFGPHLLEQIEQFLTAMEPELRTMPAVLLHADLTEDHAFVMPDEHSWRLTAVIDWADAQLGPQPLEWVAAWFGFCQRDPYMFEALVTAAAPYTLMDAHFRRQMLALTFLHPFGPRMISEQITDMGLSSIVDLPALQAALWPETN